MKTKKMSLANIQGKLSRDEMKNIMAGDAPGGGDDGLGCTNDNQCTDGKKCCPNHDQSIYKCKTLQDGVCPHFE